MSNPFATAPTGNNPFGAAPATAEAPPAAPPVEAAPAPVSQPADPFGDTPPAPEMDGINSDDAAAGTVVVLRITGLEERVASNFKDASGNVIYQDKLIVDVLVVTGPKAGKVYPDQWLFWNRVVSQFKDRVGDGRPYLVKLGKVGRAVITEPVSDPAVRAEAIRLMNR